MISCTRLQKSAECPRLARACIELIVTTSKKQYQSKVISTQVSKSNIEEILMKNQNIVMVLHEAFNIKNKRNI